MARNTRNTRNKGFALVMRIGDLVRKSSLDKMTKALWLVILYAYYGSNVPNSSRPGEFPTNLMTMIMRTGDADPLKRIDQDIKINGVQIHSAHDLLEHLQRKVPRLGKFFDLLHSRTATTNRRYTRRENVRYKRFIMDVFRLGEMNSNTKIMNSSFMELNNIRNIPVEKRVYLMPDVTNSGKIKHVYNADGLYSWFAAQRRAYVNSPFTRRRVYVTDIKPLRGNELYLLDYSDAVAASRYLENTPIPN